MNILFTSIGRRVELVQAFREAAEQCKVNLTIIGGDVSSTAPALVFCDKKIKTPKINDKAYIPFLMDYCTREEIDALIPTIDTDLLILAENKKSFLRTRIIVSSPDMIKICRDKMLTASFFKNAGLLCPDPVDDFRAYKLGYPAFIKPKDGSSSVNAYKVNNEKELEMLSRMVPDYIVQPYINGTEYTVDAFCDFDGNPIYITPRIRLAVRSGEVLKTRIRLDERIITETKQLIAAFRPCGPITVQLIRDINNQEDFFIEINPRFGGGAPLSMKAGAKSAEILLKLLLGEAGIKYKERAAEEGAVYCRFDQSIRVE